jgi:ribosomal protein L11 methyltransferase
MPNLLGRATIVARLTTDAGTAARMHDALAECCDGEAVATSIAREADGRWSLALHFRDPPDETALHALIASVAGQAVSAHLVFEELAPTDWVLRSLEGLAPVEAGRFVVHGAHDRGRVGANRIAIQIEAGLAFGTGHHGSTRGCLLALDRILKRERVGWAKARPRSVRVGKIAHAPSPPFTSTAGDFAHPTSRRKGKTTAVLDIGTGTGVLAIGAAKALRCAVLACDIDPRAVATARNNARINHVASHVGVVHAAGVGSRRVLERSPFAVIFANILLDPLRALATPVAKLAAPNGAVVLSGLLNAQSAAAVASYRARGFVLARRIALGGWTTLVLAHPSRKSVRTPRVARQLRKPSIG